MKRARIRWTNSAQSCAMESNAAQTRQIASAASAAAFQPKTMPDIRRSILRKLEIYMSRQSELNGELPVTAK